MFEYLDDELGKIKLVNVTEARANFAKLLSDDGHYYVITKNNKPQRVVISYEEFRHLRQAGPDVTSEKLSQAHSAPADTEKAVNKPLVKSQSRVKGLLSQHLGAGAGKVWPSEIEEPKITTRLEDQSHKAETNTPEPDYFETADTLSEVEDAPLVEPEHLFHDDTEEAEAAEDDLLLTELQDDLDASLAAPIEPASTPVSAEPAMEDTLSESEREYYKKYRKLYENRSNPEPSVPEKQVRLEANDKAVRQIVDSLPALDLSDDAPEVAPVMAERFVPPPPPPVADEPAPDVFHNLSESQSDLPSLQELLRELDPDSGGPHENLPEHEIDQIVRQIRDEE